MRLQGEKFFLSSFPYWYGMSDWKDGRENILPPRTPNYDMAENKGTRLRQGLLYGQCCGYGHRNVIKVVVPPRVIKK